MRGVHSGIRTGGGGASLYSWVSVTRHLGGYGATQSLPTSLGGRAGIIWGPSGLEALWGRSVKEPTGHGSLAASTSLCRFFPSPR